jgi:small-conductance mechanosensitive channel
MEYKVIKGFFKLSNSKAYKVGDLIELTDLEAKEKAKEGLIEYKVKEVKTKIKND